MSYWLPKHSGAHHLLFNLRIHADQIRKKSSGGQGICEDYSELCGIHRGAEDGAKDDDELPDQCHIQSVLYPDKP